MSRNEANSGLLKRIFDISFSGVMLVALSPVFLVISAGIKLTSKGDIIYRQKRLGKNKVPFTMYKFRTMIKNAEEHGPQLAVKGDLRITGFGRILRKYHFDELTQFWNVFKGDMSVVGPRPEREFFANEIEKVSPDYVKIFDMKPGLTSLGMVKYGYASDVKGMVDRAVFDIGYVENNSTLTDAKIIVQTIKTVLKGKGI